MASTIQIAAAQMVAQGGATISSTADIAGKKQDRLTEKRKDFYKKEDEIRDRQRALEGELEVTSDDGFLEDAGEAVLGWFGLDGLFGADKEEQLQAEIQKSEVAAQGMEAEGGLVAQDLRRLTKDAGAKVQAAQSSQRQANAAVQEQATVESSALKSDGAVQTIAPDSSAMASVELCAMESANETASIADSIQGAGIDRTKSALAEATSMKIDAIDERMEGSLFADIFQLATLGAAAVVSGGLALTSGMHSVGAINGTLCAAPATDKLIAQAPSVISAGVSSAVGVGGTFGKVMGGLGKYIGDDEATRTIAAGAADLAKVRAEDRVKGGSDLSDTAEQARRQSESLTDRVRDQRNRLKVTV